MKRSGLDGRPKRYKRSRGEVIDTERSTSRRNSIVQSERCGAHAEATSEASRSGTRFLATDINQLSRVTNERRIVSPYVCARIHRTHENGDLLHLRILSDLARVSGEPGAVRTREILSKIREYKIADDQHEEINVHKFYDVVYGDLCLFAHPRTDPLCIITRRVEKCV